MYQPYWNWKLENEQLSSTKKTLSCSANCHWIFGDTIFNKLPNGTDVPALGSPPQSYLTVFVKMTIRRPRGYGKKIQIGLVV